MARHDIDMRIPTTKVVLNADVVFEVRSDDEKLGELHVSRGSIDWHGANSKKPSSLTWERFATVMDELRH